MAGLTLEGFVKKSLDEIKTEIEDALTTTFGPSINLFPGSVFATLVGVFSEKISEVWDLAEEVYYSQYPDTAKDSSFDNLAALNNLERLEEAETTVSNVRLFGTSGTLVPASTTRFSVLGNPQNLFKPVENVTLDDGQTSIQSLSFSETPDDGTFTLEHRGEETEAIDFDASTDDIEDALNGLSHLSGVSVSGSFAAGLSVEFGGDYGKQPQPLLTVGSNSLEESSSGVDITITETQEGESQAEVDMVCVDAGSIPAPIGGLTEIETPVAGLDNAYNWNAGVLGRDRETLAEFRTRRNRSLAIFGNASLEAVRAKLLDIDGVSDAFVFENDGLEEDAQGREGKSFEAVVDGGDDEDIAEIIWKSKPAGIKPVGNDSETIKDSQGDDRTINFSRAIDVPIYVSFDLTVDEDDFPEDGEQLVKDALVEYGDDLAIGESVIIYPAVISQLSSVPGITDILLRIDSDPVSTDEGEPAVDDNITIGPVQRATITEDNISVNIL